jgi:hypothetical protein
LHNEGNCRKFPISYPLLCVSRPLSAQA